MANKNLPPKFRNIKRYHIDWDAELFERIYEAACKCGQSVSEWLHAMARERLELQGPISEPDSRFVQANGQIHLSMTDEEYAEEMRKQGHR